MTEEVLGTAIPQDDDDGDFVPSPDDEPAEDDDDAGVDDDDPDLDEEI